MDTTLLQLQVAAREHRERLYGRRGPLVAMLKLEEALVRLGHSLSGQTHVPPGEPLGDLLFWGLVIADDLDLHSTELLRERLIAMRGQAEEEGKR